MDIAGITEGIAAVKVGFDALRNAIGLVKDAQGLLPEGDKKQVLSQTLAEADRQVRLAEAQIAQALGYPLCRCMYPPTPMLTVGYRVPPRGGPEWAIALQLQKAEGRATPAFDVHECPACKRNDAGEEHFIAYTKV